MILTAEMYNSTLLKSATVRPLILKKLPVGVTALDGIYVTGNGVHFTIVFYYYAVCVLYDDKRNLL